MPEIKSFDHIYIGGEWREPSGDGRIDVIDPASEEVIGYVPAAQREDVDLAVGAAREALDSGIWRATPLPEKIEALLSVRRAFEKGADRLAAVLTAEMGSPIAQSRAIQVATPLKLIDAYIEAASSFPFQQVRVSESGSALVTREPVGVVAAVVPWNVPLTAAIQKVVPALLTGCSVVLKPASETPLATLELAEFFRQAGLPEGVLSILPAERSISEQLVSHPGIDKVSFTGSTAAGRRIAAISGGDLKRVTMELGGKSAGIILDDADLDATVESLRMGSLRNSGQICTLKTRLLVSRTRHDEFVERLAEMVRSMPVGDPALAETQIGPMVSARQRDAVQGYIDAGHAQGARAAVGGGPAPYDRGWYVDPTVFTEVTPDMTIAQEEIFGPVLSVIPFDDEAHAVALANDSRYGLSGAVYTTDVEHGLRVARGIHTGTVEIAGHTAGFQAPVGGVKDSGIGRESGAEGLESYVEAKSYGLPRDFAMQLQTSQND